MFPSLENCLFLPHAYRVLKKSKNVLEIALILCLSTVLLSGADVKLRIYLQDGTLQSGNLVTETPESFVVLTRDGRAEVPKDKIMFINGKTLKQWQERPDKLFQTEILPSEIPTPAYVNDKAALPPPPVLPVKSAIVGKVASEQAAPKVAYVAPVSPVPVPVAAVTPVEAVAPVVPVAKTEPAAISPVTKPTPNPSVVKSASTPAPNPEKISSQQNEVPTGNASDALLPGGKKRKHARAAAAVEGPVSVSPPATAGAKSAPAETTSQPVALAVNEAGLAGFPASFSRKEFAAVYYQRGVYFAGQHQPGAALHALHMAAILNRQDPEPVLMLGKVYLEEGLLGRSRKYLTHPILKKRDDAKALLAQVDEASKQKKLHRRILYGATGAAFFSWIPLLILMRKFRKGSRRVITAETAINSPFPDVIKPVTAEPSSPVEPTSAPLAPEPAFVRVPTTEVPKPMSVPPPFPVPPAISAPPTPLAPRNVPPPPSPIIPLPAMPKPFQPSVPPPIVPEMPVPIMIPVVSSEPAPVANGFTPPAAASMPDPESVLRLASMVEQAVRKGNALAIEEQFDSARREYRTALALNPSCLEAQLGLAYLCFAQGQLDMALEFYGRCLKIDPASADAHYGIGRVLLETDHVNEAVLEFQQTLKLDPTFDDARETLTSLDALA